MNGSFFFFDTLFDREDGRADHVLGSAITPIPCDGHTPTLVLCRASKVSCGKKKERVVVLVRAIKSRRQRGLGQSAKSIPTKRLTLFFFSSPVLRPGGGRRHTVGKKKKDVCRQKPSRTEKRTLVLPSFFPTTTL